MVENCLTLAMNGIEVGEWRKSAGLSKQTVEEILQEIVVASSRLNRIQTQHLPEQIVESILNGVERKLAEVNG